MLSYSKNNNIGFIFLHSLLYTLVNSFNLLFYIIVLNEFITENKNSVTSTSNYYFFLSTAILTFIKYGIVISTILYIKCKYKLKYIMKLILFTTIICINVSLLILIYSIKDKYRFILDNVEYICYLVITGVSIGYDILLSFLMLKKREIFFKNVSYIEM
jgi:hypothetical protein